MRAVLSILILAWGCGTNSPPRPAAAAEVALASWNDGASKRALVDFVRRVTTVGSPEFVPAPQRIATFDNDGTLWLEQPMYAQMAFVVDRVRALAAVHPEWKTTQPFKGVLDGDISAVAQAGEEGVHALLVATHVNNTSEEFEGIVTDWIAKARHPVSGRLYTEMVYQPMIEVLRYLRAHDFKTYVVSGGGAEFMRPWTERVYGIPPEQVLGSRVKYKYEVRGNQPVLLRLPAIDLVDDKAGKPVGIQQGIGRRPILAFGNSDGDFEMLEWVTSAPGPRAGFLIHHTDAVREWAYDRHSKIGTLARALDEAGARGWIVVDMKEDWRAIYPIRTTD